MEEQDTRLRLDDDDGIELRSQSKFSENFDVKSREDILNFPIEKIWEQMEEIARSKQSA